MPIPPKEALRIVLEKVRPLQLVTCPLAEAAGHVVAIKPGKPQLYATLRGNRRLSGLPGNPLSALAGFHPWRPIL